MPGRSINDNILAQEILHSMRRQIASYVAIKLDMKKTYDMLSWEFLEATLLKFSFEPKFVLDNGMHH